MAARRAVERGAGELEDVLAEPDKPADASEEVQQVHDRVDIRDEVHVKVGPTPAPGPTQTVQPDPIQPQLSDTQRRAIGELVQQAAEWGRVREQAGLPIEGAHLDWRDGVPTLVTPETPQRSVRKSSFWVLSDMQRDADVVRRLEARVDELDKERRRARHFAMADPAEGVAAEQRYKEAVGRLRAVDPNSAYLP